MDYQEAIKALRIEGVIEITGNPRRVAEFFDGINVAISAMQELKMYEDNKLCLIPEDVYRKQCEKLDAYKEIGTLEEIKLLKETNLKGVEMAQISCMLKQLAEYEKIGTLDEVLEAAEKHIPKSPTYDGDGYAPDGTFVWDEWLCPCCGSRFEVEYEEHDYCPDCGQHILWEERDER